jgi:predicted DNA-binding protein (MmcQ/YjbR family)
MPKKKSEADALHALHELREFGLRYPGAHLKSPWPGHGDLAVNDKTFAYLSVAGEPFGLSCKLPQSAGAALGLPFAKPTAYGLGKSGWVSVSFAEGEVVPVDMFKEWIDESYRAQAPKRLVAELDGARPARTGTPGKAPKKRPAVAQEKTTPKKAPARTGAAKRR